MEVDTEAARWAQDDDSNVVWCESAQAVQEAVGNGHVDIEVGAAEAASVLDALSKVAPRLHSLSLTGCDLDAAALARLGALLEPTQIWGVGVSNNPGISVAAWAEFWDKLPTSVEKFDFGDNELPDEAFPKLAGRLAKGRVEELFLDGNLITDLSPLLPLLSETYGLTELDLGDTSIRDAQVLALAQALPGSCVATLVLGRNHITDAGAVPLAKALPTTQVSILHLDSTEIGDATLEALAEGLATAPLEELHVDETRITESGVLNLCTVLPSSRITLLDASENNLSEATISAIEAALPQDVVVE